MNPHAEIKTKEKEKEEEKNEEKKRNGGLVLERKSTDKERSQLN